MEKGFRSSSVKKQAPQILLTVSEDGDPLFGVPASTDEASQPAIQKFFGKFLDKPMGPGPGERLFCISGGRNG